MWVEFCDERLGGGRGLRVHAGGHGRLVGDDGDDAVAGRGDTVGDCAGVAAGRLRAADTGEGHDRDERDGGSDQSEREPFHAPDTPPRALMSHVRYRFVDARWDIGDPDFGRRAYLEGHIPGAVFVDVERELADPPGAGGRHPLPATERFVEAMSRAGVDDETYVVAYGTMGGAERLWWLLRHHGHDACAVLDLDGWHGPLTPGEETAEPSTFVSRPRTDDTIERDELAACFDSVVVVDARRSVSLARRGEPGRSRLRPHPGCGERAVERAAARICPPGDVVAYCGSGVTACVPLHRLHLAGREGRLYPGSWSEWEQHPELPVERWGSSFSNITQPSAGSHARALVEVKRTQRSRLHRRSDRRSAHRVARTGRTRPAGARGRRPVRATAAA